MQKLILIFTISFLVFSCNNKPLQEVPSTSSDQGTNKVENQSKIGRTNYAVIWTWTTTKSDLVSHHLPTISEELTNLWQNDVIENAYFDSEAKSDKLDNFANVAFFLKAKSISEARSILNELTVVKQGIATYILRPVGHLWLDRKTELINKKGITKSYATVWTTIKSPLHGENADDLLEQQNDIVLELWEKGTIENVYFDIEGTYEPNNKTDFVFFVNANSQAEAKRICESLPFAQKKMASFEIHPAGVFWMGKYN